MIMKLITCWGYRKHFTRAEKEIKVALLLTHGIFWQSSASHLKTEMKFL
jgi:hypothetical protein